MYQYKYQMLLRYSKQSFKAAQQDVCNHTDNIIMKDYPRLIS